MSSADWWGYKEVPNDSIDGVVRLLTSVLQQNPAISDIRSAGSVYFSLRLLCITIQKIKFTKALDSDRRVPLEYLIRSSAQNLYHYSSNFPIRGQARFFCISLAADILSMCSIYSGDNYVFKKGREYWDEVYRLASEYSPGDRFHILKHMCVDLNNWGSNLADIDTVLESIELMETCAFHESFTGDNLIHSGYVLAFAYSAKAALIRHSQRSQAEAAIKRALDIADQCMVVAKCNGIPEDTPSLVSVRLLLGHIDEMGLVS